MKPIVGRVQTHGRQKSGEGGTNHWCSNGSRRGRGGGEATKGADGGAGKDKIVFNAATGHKRESGREGIRTT